MPKSTLENEILQRVDELVQCSISVSLKDEASRTEQLARGIAMVQEMGDLLLEVLDGREQHLQALLEQLVAQRLPDRRILQSFGNFPRDIQHIISEGISGYLRAREEKSSAQDASGTITPATAPAGDAPLPTGEATPDGDGAAAPGEENGEKATLPGTAATEETPAAVASDQGLEEALGEQVMGASPPPEPVSPPGPDPVPLTVAREPAPDPGPAPVPLAEVPPTADKGQEGEEGPVAAAAISAAPAATLFDPASQATRALHMALMQAYPEEEIIINYETRRGKIPFFLPRLQLGFEPAGLYHDWRHEFYCRQQGISIRQVASDELANPVYLARRLRREATWRQLN